MTVRRVTSPHPFSPVPHTDDVADRLQCATCGAWDWQVAPQETPHALWRRGTPDELCIRCGHVRGSWKCDCYERGTS